MNGELRPCEGAEGQHEPDDTLQPQAELRGVAESDSEFEKVEPKELSSRKCKVASNRLRCRVAA
eukprot:CAMPEP_0181201748 /NCGR_PEP_ID=MMETSP1096-20121128/18469_1 /TAXON_ID=156174 ORGANISM="Chrysochromulina ericina, Strain CCMP281" /NCGR_SAMPLE_ID=MMETSP1096 /ASSEMBLY_ACC=CAM_ASM_000453 /LENGTH=63 /DNA_ID=CAMNT_0023292205 /DNA_START=523 /DNA_END=710 /DNA_ORIENTATION=+